MNIYTCNRGSTTEWMTAKPLGDDVDIVSLKGTKKKTCRRTMLTYLTFWIYIKFSDTEFGKFPYIFY